MDYGKKVCAMLEHLSEHRSAEALSYFIRCMSYGIAQSSAFVDKIEVQQALIDSVCEAIRAEAPELFAREHSVDSASYLKHYFKPEKMNG